MTHTTVVAAANMRRVFAQRQKARRATQGPVTTIRVGCYADCTAGRRPERGEPAAGPVKGQRARQPGLAMPCPRWQARHFGELTLRQRRILQAAHARNA